MTTKQSTKLMTLSGIMMLASGFILVIIIAINHLSTLNIQTSSWPFALIMLATGIILLIRSRLEKQSANE